MSTQVAVPAIEADIWGRLLRPDQDDLTPEAARFFLRLRFDSSDLDRMHELAVKHQDGILSSQEEQELRGYRRVGLQLDLLRAKALLALRNDSSAS